MKRRLTNYAAGQLGHPHGLGGRVVAPLLNWQNREWMNAAVDLMAPAAGADVADVGFGGGHALGTLLDRVGPGGRVVGADPSRTAVDRAERRYRRELGSGRLVLTQREMSQLDRRLVPRRLDGVMSINTAYYIGALEAGLAGVKRILQDGGVFVLGVGDPTYMAGLPFATSLILRPVTELVDTLTLTGFEVRQHVRTSDDPRAFHLLRCVSGSRAALGEDDAAEYK